MQYHLFLSRATWFVVITATLTLWGVSGMLLWLGYDACVRLIGDYLHADESLIAQIQNSFFTKPKYSSLLVLLPAIGCFWIGLCISLSVSWVNKFWLNFIEELACLKSGLVQLKPQNGLERWVLGAVLGSFFILLSAGVVLFPMTYDEAWFYDSHIKRSPLNALFYYPYPGNHVFYTFIASCLQKIVPDFRSCMRLPNMFLSLVSVCFIWGYGKAKLGTWKGTLWATIMSLGFSVVLYGFLGRGYLLFTVATCLFLAALIRWHLNERSTLWPVLALCFGFIAGATQPTFLYWIGISHFWVLFTSFTNRHFYQRFLGMSFWLSVLLVTWYLPAISLMDFTYISQNELLKTYPYSELWNLFPEYWNYIWESITMYKLGGVLAIFMFLCFIREYVLQKKTISLFLVFLTVLPLVVVLAQGILPPDKTWMPLLFVWGSFFLNLLASITLKENVVRYLATLTAALMLVHQIIGFIPAAWGRFETDFSAKNVYFSLQKAGAKRILIPAKWEKELYPYAVILRGYEQNQGNINLVQTFEASPDAILHTQSNSLPDKITILKQAFEKKYQDQNVVLYIKK